MEAPTCGAAEQSATIRNGRFTVIAAGIGMLPFLRSPPVLPCLRRPPAVCPCVGRRVHSRVPDAGRDAEQTLSRVPGQRPNVPAGVRHVSAFCGPSRRSVALLCKGLGCASLLQLVLELVLWPSVSARAASRQAMRLRSLSAVRPIATAGLCTLPEWAHSPCHPRSDRTCLEGFGKRASGLIRKYPHRFASDRLVSGYLLRERFVMPFG